MEREVQKRPDSFPERSEVVAIHPIKIQHVNKVLDTSVGIRTLEERQSIWRYTYNDNDSRGDDKKERPVPRYFFFGDLLALAFLIGFPRAYCTHCGNAFRDSDYSFTHFGIC